jgi:hypothetical protein
LQAESASASNEASNNVLELRNMVVRARKIRLGLCKALALLVNFRSPLLYSTCAAG